MERIEWPSRAEIKSGALKVSEVRRAGQPLKLLRLKGAGNMIST